MTQDTRSSPTQDSPADVRAREVEEQMTDDERFSMVISVMAAVPFIGLVRDKRIPEGTAMSAGYTPGVPRLGVPALQSSDASMGINNLGYRPDDKGATALPASIVVGSSFNPELAREGGAMIGREARIRGFNAMLAGGINLARDVRNGRNFEYYSEDPLLSAVLGAEAISQRHPGRGRHLDTQALHAQLQRDQPPLARRNHRPGRALRVGLARLPHRDRALAAQLHHEWLQHDQRRVRLRESSPPAQRGAQRRLGLPRLGDVRLGAPSRAGTSR
jgi:hypothetical protein